MTAQFIGLSDDVIDEYVCGKCMYLAAALHRQYGYEIQVAVDQMEPSNPYISHAWVIEPETGDAIDIDGQYPMSKNGWIGVAFTSHFKGLNESALEGMVDKLVSHNPHIDGEWGLRVAEAKRLIDTHFKR